MVIWRRETMGGGRGRTGSAGGKGGGGAIDLSSMNDQQISDFVSKAMSDKVPSNLNANDPTQRLIYAMNWNDKPDLVASSKAEAMAKKPDAKVLYRTVSDTGNLTAKQIADSTLNGDVFKSSGNGGRVYGGGAYFANKASESRAYGYGKAFTIGAVLNKKAKVVNMKDLKGNLGSTWLRNHPKAARSLGFKVDSQGITPITDTGKSINKKDRYTSLAAAMGYNVVQNDIGHGDIYYTVLSRGALTTSDKNYFTGAEMN